MAVSNFMAKGLWFLLLTAFVVQVGFFIKGYNNVLYTHGILDELHDNLDAKPIKEFKFAEVGDVVPDSWEEVKAMRFPGMSAYCNCSGKYVAKCAPAEKPEDAKCVQYDAIPASDVGHWKGKKLIFRRYKKKEIVYATLGKSGVAECEGGFKLCTNVHCVKDYVHCPINSFWLNERKAQWIEETPFVEKFEIGPHELILERGRPNNRIVNGFSLELNGMPCYNPRSSHKLVTKKGSALASKLGGEGCTKPWLDNVEDYRSVDNIEFLEFIKTRHSDYVSGIPNSELSHLLEETVHLTARFKLFMDIKKECQSFDTDKIGLFSMAVMTIFNINKMLLVISGCLFFYFMGLSKKAYGPRFMWLGGLNAMLSASIYLIVLSTNKLAGGFIDDVNNVIYPSRCLGETKLGKLLVDNTNRVHAFMHSQETVTMVVFTVCGVLFVLGFLLKLIMGDGTEKKVLTGAQSKVGKPIDSKKMK